MAKKLGKVTAKVHTTRGTIRKANPAKDITKLDKEIEKLQGEFDEVSLRVNALKQSKYARVKS